MAEREKARKEGYSNITSRNRKGGPIDSKDDRRDEIAEYEEALRIDRNALDDALVEQPELYFRIGDRLALAVSKRDAAKNELELVEAEVDSTVRLTTRDAVKKTTEREIQAEVLQHRDVRSAQENLIYLTHQAARWAALQAAMSQRSYVLKDLVALHLKAYYASEGAGANASPRNQMYERNRAEMAEERSRSRGREVERAERDR